MPSQHRYLFLDALRGIAAISVGLLHAGHVFRLAYRPEHGVLAVDFFFCLSGFVIALAYEKKLQEGMRARTFVAMRVIRLYPLIALSILLGALFPLSLMDAMWQSYTVAQMALFVATALLLLPAGLHYGLEAYPVNNPIWSLFFELFINAIYGAVGRKLSTRTGLAVLSLLGIALACTIWGSSGISSMGFETYRGFARGFLRVSYPFLAGVLIFRLTHGRGVRHPYNWAIPVALLGLMLLTTSWTCSPLYDAVCVLIAVPLIVTLGVYVKTDSSLMNRVFAWLGAISYPFYLLHLPILRAFSFHTGWLGHNLNLCALAGLLAAAVSADVLMRVYDTPVRAWLTAKLLAPRAVR